MSYLRGTGTASDPYVVHNKEALKKMLTVDYCGGKFFEVIADIDCAGEVFSYYAPNVGFDFLHISATADFTLKMNGYKCSGFVMANLSSSYTISMYPTCNFSIEFGTMLFTLKTASYLGSRSTKINLTDVRLSCGKKVPATNNGNCTRCFFDIPLMDLSSANACYAIGVASGCTNVSATPYDPSAYPKLKERSDRWILDGVSYPATIRTGRPDLTTSFAIKGTTRVGNSRKSRNVTILSGAYRRPIWEGKSDAEGKFLAPLYDYYDAVIPLIFDDYGYPLKKDTNYVVGDVIHPSSPTGYRYICEQAGTSGPTLPAEPWSVEVLLTVGTAKFRPYPVYEPKCLGPMYPEKVNLITGEKV